MRRRTPTRRAPCSYSVSAAERSWNLRLIKREEENRGCTCHTDALLERLDASSGSLTLVTCAPLPICAGVRAAAQEEAAGIAGAKQAPGPRGQGANPRAGEARDGRHREGAESSPDVPEPAPVGWFPFSLAAAATHGAAQWSSSRTLLDTSEATYTRRVASRTCRSARASS